MRWSGYHFVPHVAARYLRATRASGRIASSALSIVGVAAGVMTLVAVTGVMNGFQLGFIEDILEVSSYHLQVAGAEPLPEAVLSKLRSAPGVRAVVAFTDSQALVESDVADPRGCALRGIDEDALALDPGFAEHLQIVEGEFGVGSPGGIVVGAELARALGAVVGDTLRVLSLAVAPGGTVATRWESLEVTGTFQTGYYDYDAGMAFVSLGTAAALMSAGSSPRLSYGVKIASRFADAQAAEELSRLIGDAGVADAYRVASWREFNRAFFSALRLEKVLMFTLPGLIFVVVAFGIYHALRRAVYERREEIALLSALGARRGAIRAVFVLEGALIGLAGGAPGLAAGMVISANVNALFRLAERLVNAALGLLDMLASPFAAATSGSFSIFSPSFFYLTEVPSRVQLPEALAVTFAEVLSAAAAALFASSRILDAAPAEVLRYE